MKKNTLTLIIFLVLGMVAGTLIGQLLAPVPGLSFLTRYVELSWLPEADWIIIRYDIDLLIRLNIISLAGMAAAFWIYRKL